MIKFPACMYMVSAYLKCHIRGLFPEYGYIFLYYLGVYCRNRALNYYLPKLIGVFAPSTDGILNPSRL